ncbi:hypothetical protein DICPUDRAFT_153930 [Dictyostelium purpureum]|uniref:Uncharacterized protein n=1 Tax=Dictyostelium purpureum TaxID=5786 RepID=F0ZQ42_DICPU|nr:uncharacterized protein DICPUDRAFT_153930 [Dictyostelium purpureum]EGC33956.1 hypothetical protein DICPUDRAFT_153930 [Dictyostelium purpureum]|eukprot:XP_003289538.1 hypothetical protein DICPUDRAFT_153930 [Dictyostelium purpureum]
MILFEDVVASFISNINDYAMLVVSFLGTLVLFLIGPILNLINIRRNKIFPDPKTIVITGASSGLGVGIALEYSKEGNNLLITGRNKERLEQVKTECAKKGANVEIALIDIADREAMKSLLLKYDKKYTVDLVVANAAVSELMLPEKLNFVDRTYDLVDINVYGMLNTVLPLIDNMEARGTGQIAITSSLTEMINFVFPAYTGSKGFCTSYGLTLRNRLAESGVGVSVIAPGFVYSRMSDSLKQESLPFCVTPEQGAKVIRDGLARNKAYIAFSLPTLLYTYFNSIIPPNLKDGWNYISTFFFSSPDFNRVEKKKQ